MKTTTIRVTRAMVDYLRSVEQAGGECRVGLQKHLVMARRCARKGLISLASARSGIEITATLTQLGRQACAL